MGETFQIETVSEKQVHRRGEDQLQQSTVKKGQLQLQAVEIDVFEVRGEVATLVIQHQENMECTNGICAADAVQLHANAFCRVPAECLRNAGAQEAANEDRKSTRLNSSHGYISYAVFCLKKKKTHHT